MKKNNGITMISLTVTIIILALISGITITVNMEAFHIARIQNFVTKMKVIQGKVDNIAEEMDEVTGYGSQVTDDSKGDVLEKIIRSDTIDKNISWDNDLDKTIQNYYYFTPEDLKQLGLNDQDMAVFINFKTRNVISEKGVKRDGKVYYRQYDLENGDILK